MRIQPVTITGSKGRLISSEAGTYLNIGPKTALIEDTPEAYEAARVAAGVYRLVERLTQGGIYKDNDRRYFTSVDGTSFVFCSTLVQGRANLGHHISHPEKLTAPKASYPQYTGHGRSGKK